MKYDFTSIMDRRGKDAIAVDLLGEGDTSFTPGKPKEGYDAIPMWVADMNFPTCPSIPEAVIERAKHPAYGYFTLRDEYFDKIIEWQRDRNDVQGLTRDAIGYENGVLGGVLSALGVFCSQGDKVLVHSPTYIGFTGSLTNAGYHIVHSPLVKDDAGIWRMDFEDMEKTIRDQHIHAAIFCSPHNPTGRVWTKEEILRFMELCRKYDVYVISDEIWSDIILKGHHHVPTQSVSPDAANRTVALYAPSKTFNLAGLIGSYHIIYNSWIRDRVRKESSLSHYNNANVLSMYALIGAYKPEGYEWVNELCSVLSQNIAFAVGYIKTNFPSVKVSQPEGTYMLFVDCTEYCRKSGKTLDDVLGSAWDVGVAVQDGRPFHGLCHIRVNLALPLSRVREAFERLRQYVFV
jgi:cystathionine beta-lyase